MISNNKIIEACNFNMTNRRYVSQIESQLASINKSLHTIGHHLTVADNGRVQLEMEYMMTLITELSNTLLNPENIGRQPEETVTLDNTTDYYDCILLKL